MLTLTAILVYLRYARTGTALANGNPINYKLQLIQILIYVASEPTPSSIHCLIAGNTKTPVMHDVCRSLETAYFSSPSAIAWGVSVSFALVEVVLFQMWLLPQCPAGCEGVGVFQ